LDKERLDRENGEIERELIGLDRVLEGLEFLSTDVPPEIEEPGFTEEIRKLLQRANTPLTAVEIRDALLALGIKPSSAKNLLISVHTILGRLKSDLKESDKDGKPSYVWKYAPRRRHVFPSSRFRVATDKTTASTSPIYGSLPSSEEK